MPACSAPSADVFDLNRRNSDALRRSVRSGLILLSMVMLCASLGLPAKAESGRQSDNLAQGLHNSLHINPFERPAPVLLEKEIPQLFEVTEPIDWQPVLKATLVGGRYPAANVDGTIVYVGDKVAAFVLVEVHERSAVFEKEGVRRILKMDD